MVLLYPTVTPRRQKWRYCSLQNRHGDKNGATVPYKTIAEAKMVLLYPTVTPVEISRLPSQNTENDQLFFDRIGGWDDDFFGIFEAEDVAEAIQLAPPDETHAIFADVALKPVVAVAVVESLEVAGGTLVEAIFERDVVEERVVGAGHVCPRGNLSAQDDAHAIVPKPFGEFERIVGVHVSAGVGHVVESEAQVERSQGFACDVVDLTLEEGTQGVVHRESAGVSVGQIHAGGEHGDGQFSAFVDTHGVELVADGHILRGVDGELEPHVFEGFGNDDAAFEVDDTPIAPVGRDGGLGGFGGRDVEPRVHRVAGELNIAAVFDGEGFQRDDG